MKILVCISNVPDTTTKIRLNNDQVDTNDIQWIINPWDELALTRAMELKESNSGIQSISVATVGDSQVEPTLRKALAVGADEAFRINSEAGDAYTVAKLLSQLVEEQKFDLVLCGIESSDYNGSSVGGMLAEFLDSSSVSAVSSIEFENGELSFRREIDGGYQKLRSSLPVVAIVQKGIAINPRIPAMRGIMMARKKPLSVLDFESGEAKITTTSLHMPESKKECQYFEQDQVDDLVKALKNEAKVI